MTGYINNFNENKNKSKVKNKKLFQNNNEIWKKKKLIDTDFNTKPTYGDDDKYIKTKIKHMKTI